MYQLRVGALVAWIVAASVSPVSSMQGLALDGHWWQSTPSSVRTFVVAGMLSGYESGWDDASIWAAQHRGGVLALTMLRAEPRLAGQIGAIVNRIDAVYDENPDMLSRPVSLFIGCAARKNGGCSDRIDALRKTAER